MKYSKKIFIALAFFGLSAGATTTFAQTWNIGATTADNVTATISGSGTNLTLTISGTGNMQNYASSSDVPWLEWSIRSNLKTLVIEDGVTSIGNEAFYFCTYLTGTLTIPNSVTYIGNSAFGYCSGLTGTLNIPDGVASIGYATFAGCSGLTGALIIPNSVTSIGSFAFYECSGFTGTLTIPNAVTSIGQMAFYGCSGFTGTLTIPASVTYIVSDAFTRCNLTAIDVDVNSQHYSSQDGILYNITKTYLIQCPAGKTGTLTIPNSVTLIYNSAFYGCSGLTGTLTFPNSVTSIPSYAFYGCSGFTSLIIGNSVTSIGDGAFSECSGLTSITCEAIMPPVYEWSEWYSSFYGVPANIPVYVPCGYSATYQASLWGNYFTNFTNIIGSCPYATVTLYVNNNTLGSISGNGRHDLGTTATLFAIPKAGNIFIGWEEDGNTENPRTITVTQDITFTANFTTVPACDNTALLAKIAGLEADTAFFKNQIRTLTATCNQNTILLQEKIDNLQIDTAFLKSQIATLTASNTACNQNAAILQGKIDGLQSDTALLNSQIATLTADNGTCNQNVTVLQGKIDNLQSDTALLNSQITDLQNQLNAANETISDLEEDLTECDADRANLAQMLYECEHLGVETPHSAPLKIYPNPVPSNGKLNIENETLKAGDKLEIFDMSGKLFSTHTATGIENSIRIGNLPQGTYLLRLAGKRGVKFEVK